MTSAPSPQIELNLLHPAVAHLLDGRGFDWYHEVRIAGRYRIDFLVFGHDRTSLIDCKSKLKPKLDIPKMNFYHEIYGDPRANKIIAMPNDEYDYEVIRQYTQAGISILRVEGNFSAEATRGNYWRVRDLYPEHDGSLIHLTREQITEIRTDYNRYKVTLQDLAQRFDVGVATIEFALKSENRISQDYSPTEYFEDSL